MLRLLFFALFCTAGILTQAATLQVPQDYPSIQGAIDAAADGDTVLVADSTYVENIYFKGKAITVASHFLVDGDTTHINNTIIDGSQPSHPDSGSVVFFMSGEDTTSMICGFTITGGTGTESSDDSRVGGGIFCHLSGARIVHNKVVSNSITSYNARGGGIGTYPYGNDNFTIIQDNIIVLNSCTGQERAQGGGIYMPQGRIVHNIIRDNSCTGQGRHPLGGGIHGAANQAVQRHLYVQNNTIENNECSNPNPDNVARGGGVDVWGGVVLYLLDNTITKNRVNSPRQASGGGVDMSYSVAPGIIQGNIIADNYCEGRGYGGGIEVLYSEGIRILNNRFSGNEATADGGGLDLYESSGIIIEHNKFIQNEAANSGGGLYMRLSSCSITGNDIRGNSCTSYYGGGICIRESSPEVINNLIVDNKAGMYGGGICAGDTISRPALINNTIVANTARLYGGGLNNTEASTVILNSIFWDNAAPNSAQISFYEGSTLVAYSDIMGGWEGEGNIDLDPLFAMNDTLYHLSESSPCINAGIDSHPFGDRMCYCPADDYETDMNFPFEDDGMPRPFPGTRPDMGADETDVIEDTEIKTITELYQPQQYVLDQNYPNPFNPTTTIEYTIQKNTHVEIKIVDLLGREVCTLVTGENTAGTHQVTWNGFDNTGSPVASGVYFYQMTADGFSETRKLLLIR